MNIQFGVSLNACLFLDNHSLFGVSLNACLFLNNHSLYFLFFTVTWVISARITLSPAILRCHKRSRLARQDVTKCFFLQWLPDCPLTTRTAYQPWHPSVCASPTSGSVLRRLTGLRSLYLLSVTFPVWLVAGLSSVMLVSAVAELSSREVVVWDPEIPPQEK